jgi:hypothetical protein
MTVQNSEAKSPDTLVKSENHSATVAWHHFKYGLATLILVCGLIHLTTGHATKNDLQQWTTFRIELPSIDDDWFWGIWSQVRFDDDISHFNWLLINPSIHHKLKDGLRVGFGYQYIIENDSPNEQEPWGEFAVSTKFDNGFVLGNRVRLEARFLDDVAGPVYRLRYRINGAFPFKDTKSYLTLSEAVWANLNEQASGPTSGFDQNRLFAGIGTHVGKYLRIEAGYQWRYKDNGGSESRSDHIIMLQFLYETKGKDTLKPVRSEAHY